MDYRGPDRQGSTVHITAKVQKFKSYHFTFFLHIQQFQFNLILVSANIPECLDILQITTLFVPVQRIKHTVSQTEPVLTVFFQFNFRFAFDNIFSSFGFSKLICIIPMLGDYLY